MVCDAHGDVTYEQSIPLTDAASALRVHDSRSNDASISQQGFSPIDVCTRRWATPDTYVRPDGSTSIIQAKYKHETTENLLLGSSTEDILNKRWLEKLKIYILHTGTSP